MRLLISQLYSCKHPDSRTHIPNAARSEANPHTCLLTSEEKFSIKPLTSPSPPPQSVLLFSSEVNWFFVFCFFCFAFFTGNGYIEGKELENFFQELEKARKGSGMVSPVLCPIVCFFYHPDHGFRQHCLSQAVRLLS